METWQNPHTESSSSSSSVHSHRPAPSTFTPSLYIHSVQNIKCLPISIKLIYIKLHIVVAWSLPVEFLFFCAVFKRSIKPQLQTCLPNFFPVVLPFPLQIAFWGNGLYRHYTQKGSNFGLISTLIFSLYRSVLYLNNELEGKDAKWRFTCSLFISCQLNK